LQHGHTFERAWFSCRIYLDFSANYAKYNSNASGGGQLMIRDGAAVFQADDIVVMTVEIANPAAR